MNWTERIQNIYAYLNQNGFKHIIDDMIKDYGIGGTQGEQFSIVCTWLAKLRNRNKDLYGLIRVDADEILADGIRIKYFTEDYYKKQ
jgi:hypothetical protein